MSGARDNMAGATDATTSLIEPKGPTRGDIQAHHRRLIYDVLNMCGIRRLLRVLLGSIARRRRLLLPQSPHDIDKLSVLVNRRYIERSAGDIGEDKIGKAGSITVVHGAGWSEAIDIGRIFL